MWVGQFWDSSRQVTEVFAKEFFVYPVCHLQTLISGVLEFLVVLFPLTCSLCLVNSILTASVTKTVDKSESGAMLGLNMAVHSIIRSVAPTIGGYLMSAYGFESLGYVGVACNIVARVMKD